MYLEQKSAAKNTTRLPRSINRAFKTSVWFTSLLLVFGASTILLSGCSSTSTSNLEQSELSSSEASLNWILKTKRPYSNPELSELLSRIANHLSAANEARETPYQLAFPWKIKVVVDEQPNAYSLGGGNILLTTGLLQALPSEASLAAIIGHEMAHQYLGHVRIISRDEAESEPYSVNEELAADKLGIELMKGAGYDPRITFDALTIGYVPTNSLSADELLEKRAKQIHQLLIDESAPFSGTITTRQFKKLKSSLVEPTA